MRHMDDDQQHSTPQNRNVLYSWVTHEYEHSDKTADWFWTLGIIALASAIGAIIFGNVLFAIVVLLGAFVMGMYAARQPDDIEIKITTKGIRAGETLFPYRSLEAFWIDDEDPNDDIPPRLLVRSKKMIMPLLVFHLTLETPPDDVRAALRPYLPETHLQEPLSHKLLENIGF
jgi:hypothetical protein